MTIKSWAMSSMSALFVKKGKMMKRLIQFTFLMFLINSNMNAQDLIDKMKPFGFLVGKYEVKVFMPDGKGGWADGGGGEAHFLTTLGGTYIEENIATQMGQGNLTMKNTIGIDGRTQQLRLIAMDKEYSSMDVYNGKYEGTVLKFDNLNSDRAFVTQSGASLHFRLTYKRETSSVNSLLVEYTSDKGETWSPYARHTYNRK